MAPTSPKPGSKSEDTEHTKSKKESATAKEENEDAETSKEKFIARANEQVEKMTAASTAAEEARQRASELGHDTEAGRKAIEEATHFEATMKKHEKMLNRLQSGAWQGGAGGAGIGAGIGAGVGTVVGTVVGGVVSVPTTGLGLLAGAGTGAVHGPWFKLPGHGEKEEGAKQSNDDKDEKDASE